MKPDVQKLRPALAAPERRTAEVRFEDEKLRISVLPGPSRRMVIVFTGLGQGMGPAAPEEFAGSARGTGQGNTVVFVVDKTSLWYEIPGVADRIRDELRALITEIGPKHLLHVGNSMGGYGAILFAKDTGARRVLAFGPQFSIKPGVVEGEARWIRAAQRIGRVNQPSLAEALAPGIDYTILHGLDGPDALQAAAFPQVDGIHHYLIPTADHDTGRHLKAQGALAPLLGAALRGQRMRVDRLLREAGATHRAALPPGTLPGSQPRPVPAANWVLAFGGMALALSAVPGLGFLVVPAGLAMAACALRPLLRGQS